MGAGPDGFLSCVHDRSCHEQGPGQMLEFEYIKLNFQDWLVIVPGIEVKVVLVDMTLLKTSKHIAYEGVGVTVYPVGLVLLKEVCREAEWA